MNIYSKALRHINMNDVKQKHQQKIIEKKIQEERKMKEEEYIALVMKESRYDWRKELFEQMTTADVFYATLSATGDLTISSNDFSDPDTDLLNSFVSGTDAVMVSTEDSPTIVGANYTNFRQVRTSKIDASKSTTITISVDKPTSQFSTWQDRDPGENFNDNIQVVAYSDSNPLETSFEISTNFSGTQTINLPSNLRVSDLKLQFSQFGLMPFPGVPDVGTQNATITVVTTQRKTPINVFVPLDSPEATSFIRSDPSMANLSPEERLKKLKEMLEAGDEYVIKMLGTDFPGTGAVPPGEYDPFAQPPPGEAGDTPGVQMVNYQGNPITDPDDYWRNVTQVSPETFQQIYQQKVASGQITPSTKGVPWTQQQPSQNQTSNYQSSEPGYMDIQVGDQRITRSYDSAGNYTDADTGWQPDPNYSAYKAGGGDAKMDQGLSYDQVVALGKTNIATQQVKNTTTSQTKTQYSIDDLGAANYSAYKAGGGDAELKSGKSVQDIIAQGKQNLGQYDSGPKTTSTTSTTSTAAKPLIDLVKKVAGEGSKIFNGINDGLSVLVDVSSAIKVANKYGGLEPPAPGSDRPTIISGSPGSRENPVPRTLSSSTNKTLAKGINRNMSGPELRRIVQNNINTDFNFGAKGTLNNLTSDPYFNEKGDLVIDDTYAFDAGGDVGKKPFLFGGTTGDFAKTVSGSLAGSGGEYEKNRVELEKDILTKFDQSIGALLPGLTPGRKDPVVNIRITIPSSQIKESFETKNITEKRKLKSPKEVLSSAFKKHVWKKLNEMTTADVFYTSLPAEGEVDLVSNDVSINFSGGTPGEIGSPSEGFYARTTTIGPVDTSRYDTIGITVTVNSSIDYGEGLILTSGSGLSGASVILSPGSTSGTYYARLPSSSSASSYRLVQVVSSTGSSTFTINKISYQRRSPKNIFVSLDSPEATSFIRSDPAFAGLSEAEKKQKLKEMLEAGDEYVMKMFGDEFPGSGAVPPGESGDTPGVETIDYGDDLTPLSKNPYGTEVGQIAGYDPMYANIKSGQVPYMKPDKARQLLSNPKYQKLWDDDPDALKIVQRLAGA